MTGLWSDVYLPVAQKIREYGGNFISALVCRAVIDEIDERADRGDLVLIEKRNRIIASLQNGDWPYDPVAFSAFFEIYHEALFYILADRRSVGLTAIPEGSDKTPDFTTTASPVEAFEIKTIDFTGGEFAYSAMANSALDAQIKASEESTRKGVGFAATEVQPHGDAKDSKEAIERVMRQIDGNVKAGQFETYPTFLVVPLIRTALRASSEELDQTRLDPDGGESISGHLWTIAFHGVGEPFYDATDSRGSRCLGSLERAGILKDHAFIRGLVFVHTEWSELGDASQGNLACIDRSYRLYGEWNDNYAVPPSVEGVPETPNESAFAKLCDEWR